MAAGPGKTSPKLYTDFLLFDPIWGNPNVLANTSPPVGQGVQLAPSIGSCKHSYATIIPQSVLPPLDLRSDGSTIYKHSLICQNCRIHAEVWIDHSNSTNSCPNSENPLHHFQRVPNHDRSSADRLSFAWRCSAEECHAALIITYRTPRLKEPDVKLLIDSELLKRRYDTLVQDDPSREGLRQATQMEALSRLRKYIKDSLNPEHNRRQFPANNKRFQEAFGIEGQDCKELLDRCGFQYADGHWNLPNPAIIHDRLRTDGSSMREVLEDVELELLALMYTLSREQAIPNPAATSDPWNSANRDIERTLAAQGYTRHVPQRRGAPSNTDLPYFNSLGALPDFSDSLIEFAYDRQIVCDPELAAYYFECLEVISEARNTEQLQMKVATLKSQDVVSRRDITAAYRYFNITPTDAKTVTDSRIIEIYQAQQPDLGAAAQEQARKHLGVLGVARNSTLLTNASRQTVDTYEEALAWLGNGVNKDTADEGVLAVLAIKVAPGNQADEEIARKAISTIAKARHSNMLNDYLLNGTVGGYSMSVDEALAHLGISAKLESLDPYVLPIIFSSARQDKPGENTEKAIGAIQKALQHTTAAHSPETWPVGLTSHGNTCYLNSLLQYYFSIQPLRDIVLNYDKYKLDTTAHAEKEGRVGRLKVSTVEIKGGQRFADNLKELFERMIKSRDSAVKPEEDLVCRAFLDPNQYMLLDPGLTVVKSGGDESAIMNGVEDTAISKVTTGETLASPTGIPEEIDSGASSTTLQASVNGDDPDISMKTVELPPTPPDSPGLKGEDKDAKPPLPPRRRFSTGKEEALEIAKRKAKQQQDVTEVHDGVMFRLRCGMKGRGRDVDEEQVDELRDLFSIQMEETVSGSDKEETRVLADTSIQLDVPTEPTDIYSALDAVFDLQPYGDDRTKETYKSIKALPPLLQISIPRIGYDATGAYKSEDCVKLQDELYLDRYLASGVADTLLAKRRKCWDRRKRLRVLKMEQKILSKTTIDLDGPTAISQAGEYLTSLDEINRELREAGIDAIEADGDITEALRQDSTASTAYLQQLDAEGAILQRNLDAEFVDLKEIKYRLAAVFFHRGAHGGGHYWIYIHDFANDVWRIYNDERVEEFTKLSEIFEAKEWNQGTPTYAVYVANDQLDLVQAVCRDPEREPTPPPPLEDTTMVNGGSQQPDGTINPKLLSTTTEGGDTNWDESRQVADGVKW